MNVRRVRYPDPDDLPRTYVSIGSTRPAALLYEVAPHDWMVLSASILVILGVAMAASLVPATRAVRTPTTMLLKSE